MYLSEMKKNDIVTIMEIKGGCTSRIRLCELGMNKGTTVRVIKNDIGPLIISTEGHKLAIGRNLAEKIIVC